MTKTARLRIYIFRRRAGIGMEQITLRGWFNQVDSEFRKPFVTFLIFLASDSIFAKFTDVHDAVNSKFESFTGNSQLKTNFGTDSSILNQLSTESLTGASLQFSHKLPALL